jgi:hypothetical protein
VRIENPAAAGPVPQRQQLRLELDPVLALGFETQVERGRSLDFGVAELEHELRVADRKTRSISDPTAQNEASIAPDARSGQILHWTEDRVRGDPRRAPGA